MEEPMNNTKITIGKLALAFGRAMNQGWALLATPDASRWPVGWHGKKASEACELMENCDRCGACADLIYELVDEYKSLAGQACNMYGMWNVDAGGIVFATEPVRGMIHTSHGFEPRLYSLFRLKIRRDGTMFLYVDVDEDCMTIELAGGEVNVGMRPYSEEFINNHKHKDFFPKVSHFICELQKCGAKMNRLANEILLAAGYADLD